MQSTKLKNSIEVNGSASEKIFEAAYLAVREKEQRIYSDEIVAQLPTLSPTHRYYNEWAKRKKSHNKLVEYIGKKGAGLSILEVGCGNGWLSNSIATLANAKVLGIDLNKTEVEQAERVFKKNKNAIFLYSDIYSLKNRNQKFDLIIFAASIQYFHSLTEVFDAAKELLNPLGEIHVLDSPFYTQNELQEAANRTKEYYLNLGFPEMASHYYQHTFSEIKNLGFKPLYSPKSLFTIFDRDRNPFYWLYYSR